MKWLVLIPITFFSLFIGMVVHETYHLIEHRLYDLPLRQICFIGYDTDINAAGWTHSGGFIPQSEKDKIRNETAMEYMSISGNMNEVTAVALQFATTVATLVILLRYAV